MICPLAKRRRLPYMPRKNLVAKLFDLVHCDIWAPFHQISLTGYIFFLSLVDDHSQFSWVYLMKNKTDAYHLILRFFAMVETQFNAKIQTFGYENAKEFSCGEETSTFVKCSASFIFSVSSAMSFSQNVFSQLHI